MPLWVLLRAQWVPSGTAALNSYSDPFWPNIKPHTAAFDPGTIAYPHITHDLLRVSSGSRKALSDLMVLGAEQEFRAHSHFWESDNKAGTPRNESVDVNWAHFPTNMNIFLCIKWMKNSSLQKMLNGIFKFKKWRRHIEILTMVTVSG